eukprot:2431236-Rhodomonas_salina.2
MSGTDVVYGATRLADATEACLARIPCSNTPMRCPVLTYTAGLLGALFQSGTAGAATMAGVAALLSSYAFATPCPVLTSVVPCAVLSYDTALGSAMCGTELGYVPTRLGCHARRSARIVAVFDGAGPDINEEKMYAPTRRRRYMPLRATPYHFTISYAVSGTEIAYAATRCSWTRSRSDPCLPTRLLCDVWYWHSVVDACAVLTQHRLLPGLLCGVQH